MQNRTSRPLQTARNITAVNTAGLQYISPEQTDLSICTSSCYASYRHSFGGICKSEANNVFK
jgi:hypothetical protein